MREPETLKELIEWLEWNYERFEDEHDVICSFTDGDGFHELLNDLRNKSAMCEANAHSVLSEVRAELLKIAVCNKHYGRAYLELSEVLSVIDAKISEHFR